MTSSRRWRIAGFALVLVACAPGRQAGSGDATPEDAAWPRAMVADRLVFGRAIPGGGTVSDAQWTRFMAEVVTPRFPNGLTVWHAEGQWTGSSGVLVREPVAVVEVLHPPDPETDAMMLAIAEEYRRRFGQDAVLRVTAEAQVELIE